jgi:hypothetical protein
VELNFMKIVPYRAYLAALGFFVLVPSLGLAQTPAKQNPSRSIEVKKVFGYYDIYLRLPPQERDGFAMSYILRARDSATSRPQMNYVLGNTRTPIQIAPNGKILTLPDANMYANGKVEIPAGQPGASIGMDLEAIIPLARNISAADAANPVNDYAAALRRAGPLGLIAPKLTGITFKGVTSGEAVFGDGRRTALGRGEGGGVVFRPALPAMRGVTNLVFPAQPASAEFAK